MGRLRAIFAVLGARPGLDRIEAGKLHRAVGMLAAVHLPRLIDKSSRAGSEGPRPRFFANRGGGHESRSGLPAVSA